MTYNQDLETLLADPEVVSNWVLEKYPYFAQAALANLVNESDILKCAFEHDHRDHIAKLAATRADATRIARRLELGLEVRA